MDYNMLSPYVRFAQYSILHPPFRLQKRIILDYELIFIDGGGCRLTVGDKVYDCRKNDIIFLRPNIEHIFESAEELDFVQPHVHFDMCADEKSKDVYVCFKTYHELSEHDRGLLRRDIVDFDIPVVFQMENPHYFRMQLLEIIELFEKKDSFYQLLCKEKMLHLLYLLFSAFDKSKETRPTAFEIDMLNIKSYIDGNYSQKITLDFLAQRFFVNKYYLEVNFKKHFGISVIKYYNYVRFEKACKLLEKGDTISSVYESLGIENIYAFSRFFKNMCGKSPTQYRSAPDVHAEIFHSLKSVKSS